MATRLTFHLILHTHWDREWYLPQAGFQPRLVAAVGEVLDLLERDPDARFTLDGQTVLAEDVLDVRPEWIARATEAVAGGRLDVGPWYVLADELVPSGESMVRNLLHGSRDARALGRRMDVLYSPDAFGHPAVLPALAREFGIAAGVVWRGLGRPTGVDRDLYRWRAPGGAEILLYHLPAAGYEIGADLDGPIATLAERWDTIRTPLVERAATSHIAVFVGADHHAPPADPTAICWALQAIEADHEVRISSLSEFFDCVSPGAAGAPAISGELRWSYGHTWTLQGTHATRARLKRRHAAAELHMQRVAEPLAALAAWMGGTDRRGMLRSTTRALLKCQFHDTLCGCCSDDAAREQETRLTSIGAANRETSRAALHELSGHDADTARRDATRVAPTLLVWNPVPRRRSGIMTAEVTWFRRDVLVGPPGGRTPRTGQGFRPFEFATPDGTRIPVQVLGVARGAERLDAARHYPDQDEVDRVLVAFDSPAVPGMGFVNFRPVPGSAVPASQGLTAREDHLANRFVEVQVAADGCVNLLDRRSGERFHDILQLVDESDRGDTYTPHVPPEAGVTRSRWKVRRQLLSAGPLLGALETRFTARSPGTGDVACRVVLMLHADSPILRVRLELDNQATDHRLRLRMPVGAGDRATAGSAFGVEHRDVVVVDDEQYAAERPVTTAPAHRYVAAGSAGRGLAVLCPGHFEYEWTAAHELWITLLRAVGELSRGALPTRPGHAGWPMYTPDAQEPGRHVVELAVATVGEAELEEPLALEQLWEETFMAPQPTFIRDFVGDPQATRSVGVELDGRGLVFSALKLAEAGDALVLRCYNVDPIATSGHWALGAPITRATLARADETAISDIVLADPRVIEFEAPPHGLVTILINREKR